MKKILTQIIAFCFLLVSIFAINRLFMQNDFIPQKITQSNFYDIVKMYFYGIYHDIRFLSIAFLPLLLCGFLALIFSHINYKKPVILMGGGI
ncbi:hypothetical protein [Campylobacter armoricus]|uniref:hypothetical protein n=1 Tax=Campylobacter armoricus TaxID=2505970 RepID=UPI001F234A11|nr:hypothetical protein [Campylobacter armoricus]